MILYTMEDRPKPRPKTRKPSNGPKRKTKKMVPKGKRVDARTVANRVKNRKRIDELQHEIDELTRQEEHAPSIASRVVLRRQLAEKEEERDKLYRAINAVTTNAGTNAGTNAITNAGTNSETHVTTLDTIAETNAENTKLDDIEEVDLDDIDAVNLDAVNLNEKPMTLRERRAQNRETRKRRKEEKERIQRLLNREPVRVNVSTLKMRNRKAMHAAQLEKLNLMKVQNELDRARRLLNMEKRDKDAAENSEAHHLLQQMQTKWIRPELKKAQQEEKAMEAQQRILFQRQAKETNIPSEVLQMMSRRPKAKLRKK